MLDIEATAADIIAELNSWQVPAVEVVAVADGVVQLAQAFGTRDNTRDLPVTSATLFHHGSTGKAFTAALVATLVDDGFLEWDRPVRDYWPSFQLFDDALTRRVTVTDLLSHRSGLARHEWVWLANPSLPRAELVARMRHLPADADLSVAMRYSNLGYAAVGQLIAEITGSDWETQLRRRLLGPAGMTHTVTSVAAATAALDHALPHAERAGVVSPIGCRVMDNVAPAGQLFSCASDLAHWLLLQLGAGRVGGRQIVSPGGLAATHLIHVRVEAPGMCGIQPLGYGLGWVVADWHGRRLLWHNGEVDGFRTEIMLLPDDGVAVAACVNRAPSGLPAALTRHLAEQLLGRRPASRTTQPRTSAPDRPVDSEPPASPGATHHGTGPSRDLRDFAGTYDHPGYGRLEVWLTDSDQLAVTLGELVMEPTYRHPDTWELGYKPLDESVPLTFDTREDGSVDEAILPLEDAVAPIRFRRTARPEDPNERTELWSVTQG